LPHITDVYHKLTYFHI